MGGVSSPPPLPPVPTPDDPAVDDERRKQRIAAALRKGRRSTIKTSGLGDTSPAPIRRKTLLGQ